MWIKNIIRLIIYFIFFCFAAGSPILAVTIIAHGDYGSSAMHLCILTIISIVIKIVDRNKISIYTLYLMLFITILVTLCSIITVIFWEGDQTNGITLYKKDETLLRLIIYSVFLFVFAIIGMKFFGREFRSLKRLLGKTAL